MNIFKTTFYILSLVITPITVTNADSFRIIRVYDGDKIAAVTNGEEIEVRLVGIDAPELSGRKHIPGQPLSLKAKQHLATRVLNKAVAIKWYGIDRHGRSLCEVFLDASNINLEMLRAGLAETYRGEPVKGPNMAIYRDAEREAKDMAVGIWELRDQYFSPMDWREMYGVDE